MDFSCTIDGAYLRCEITSDRNLTAPVFCFSGMQPMEAEAGGTTLTTLGSYTEIQLPDLLAGIPHPVTVVCPGYNPANRAWMPLGPYLRSDQGCITLPPVLSGAETDWPSQPNGADALRLIPQPAHWRPTKGVLIVDGFMARDPALIAVSDLATRRGIGPFLTHGGAMISLSSADMAEDAYQLEITPEGVTLTAGSYGGRFYGGITLLTLLNNHQGSIPCGILDDHPRFAWRGQHLDCARHAYAPETIHNLMDAMALLKLNRFHWHFADDETFRLEIDCYPALWQRTALCGEGHLMPALFSGAVEAGCSYSKDDVADFVARAAALNIEIMPEIEVPAHALAMARVFPDMRDPDDTGKETSVQGYRANVVNPAMPKTWEVLAAIAKEVGALFPFGHLHLGCDELPKDTWLGSPRARDLMAQEGLETTQDLQGWTIAKLAATVAANGQRPAAWEEAAQGAQGGIANNAILFSWTGQGPGLDAARAGYDVVMTPAQHVYLDMAHTNDLNDWGANWAAYVNLTDTINWEPVPPDEPALAERIIGVQGCFWGEFTTQDDQMWPMLFPRLFGVAAKAWQVDTPQAAFVANVAAYRSMPFDLFLKARKTLGG